ncbi:hypothetical protein [Eoetvoesiella caeni]|uniref:Phosphoglycerate mutase n=1 Tax=Eoetvoesiella caeni TaxID=645616 RepID=A0A366HH12_9BURK|nr:hypothetical protein [Eoetvoesiella caeni]MCI2808666.1 hypothetical protein [Eoetvoesiella caeni]NYT55207.1 hypothetical protein [Eoetvoesiella caeni]RBP40812.1 hypothetical protein DFR37_103153 [Eoetvoesiella caeni]
MQIVLPGALPDPNAASALLPHVLETAPTLARWLQQGHASVHAADPAAAGCTPLEQWLLQSRDYTKRDGQNLSAGLGPLWANNANNVTQRDRPVWLAELVHVSPSRDGAVLLPAKELDISPQHNAALFESAQALFEGTGFALQPDSTARWRIYLPSDFAPRCASPALVSITSVNEWWPQDLQSRPWRRLLNELQMLWYDHPVNAERYAAGLVPVNSLWLFGGASPDQLGSAAAAPAQIHEHLLAPSLAQDWGGWIAALAELEQTVFKPLAGTSPAPKIVLLGRDRKAEIAPRPKSLLSRLLPQRNQAWRTWWSSQS